MTRIKSASRKINGTNVGLVRAIIRLVKRVSDLNKRFLPVFILLLLN